MVKYIMISVALLIGGARVAAQQKTEWKAVVKDTSGIELPGVTVTNLESGQETQTDLRGFFTLQVDEGDKVRFEYPEMQVHTQRIKIDKLTPAIVLLDLKVIGEANVSGRAKSARFDRLATTQLTEISKNEFRKAACCNLSESFDNTPAIDASYSDGLTGIRQIKLLGLQMSDILMTLEGLPYVTGISTSRGLQEIPATWVEGMQLSKGVASVVNGMEGNAGQINIELKKPLENSGLELNLFQNNMGRSEANANGFWQLSPNISTGMMTHYSNSWMTLDQNKDGFRDRPLGDEISLANKWQFYFPQRGIMSQVNLIYAQQKNDYGAIDPSGYYKDWQGRTDYDRQAVTWKLGKVFENQDWKSIGLQTMYSQVEHGQSIYHNNYWATESNLYANLIYQTIIVNDKNPLKLGANVYNRSLTENLSQSLDTQAYSLDEKNLGLYAEYSYTPNRDFALVLGNRIDFNSVLDVVYTPRLHLRYTPKELHTVKFQIGKATKINNLLQENLAFINSTRDIQIQSDLLYNTEYYGMPPQVSWNTGLQYLVTIPVGDELLNLAIDYQRTWFESGYLADYEQVDLLRLSVLPGKYLSQVLQAQLDMEIAYKWNARLAYRYNGVELDYDDGVTRTKPLVPRHRAFLNLEYDNGKWNWNQTLAYTGVQRLSASYFPDDQVSGQYSPDFVTYSTQLTRFLGKKWEIYAGAENLGGFTQHSPIHAELPSRLESALVWGPINKQVIYLGLNFKLNKN